MMRHLLPLALVLATSAALAETPAQGFAAASGARTKVSKIEFHDDPTDVTGKAWEFAKSLVGASGVQGLDNYVDAADFAKSAATDGFSPELVATAAAKAIAANFTPKRAEELVGKMSEKDLFQAAAALGIDVKETAEDTTKNLQRKMVEYLIETAPTVASTTESDGAKEGAKKLFFDVLGKACPPCDAAYKGYELSAEAAKAMEIAFENEKTQAMFNKMSKAGQYRFDDLQAEYTGNSTLQSEARKALEASWLAAGKTGAPTDEDVMKFAFLRYQRWQQEVEDKSKLDAAITKIEPHFTGLSGWEKSSMYGPGDETTWADKYINDYQAIWGKLTGMKGNATWPFGLGEKGVEADVAHLIKRWRQEGMSEEQIAWEMRNYAAGYGWIAKDKVGPKPPSPREQVEKRIASRLPQLNGDKMGALFTAAGITPSADFLNCLCPGGFHYYTGEDAQGPCRHIGPLGGSSWAGIDGNAVMGCSAAYPMADGRTVTGALADKLVDIRKAQDAP